MFLPAWPDRLIFVSVDTAEWGPFSLSATKGTIRAVRTTSTLVAKHDTLV